MIYRWAQELLGCQVSVAHCHKRIMADVDALTRRFGPLIATHCCIADILHNRDKTLCPLAYDSETFTTSYVAHIPQPSISSTDLAI